MLRLARVFMCACGVVGVCLAQAGLTGCGDLAILPSDSTLPPIPPSIWADSGAGCWASGISACGWRQVGLGGHPVTAIATTPWGVVAATGDSGVWIAWDSSYTWHSWGLSDHEPLSLLFTPTSPPQLMVGRVVPQGSAARLLATVDTGRSWQPRDADLKNASAVNHPVYSLARDPANPNRLYLGTDFPILRSDDGGVRWRLVMGTGDQISYGIVHLVVSAHRSGLVLAGGLDPDERAWLYRSLDYGETWQSAQPFGLTAPAWAPAIAVDPVDAAGVWAGTRDGLWHSTDSGATWVQVRSTPISSVYAAGAWVVALTSGAAPDTVLFIGDNGTTWQPLSIPPSADLVRPVAVDPSGALLVGSSRNGVWRVQR